jgi:predicted ATPase/DNA-binding winged helix-turn-helix (wHTH) protein
MTYRFGDAVVDKRTGHLLRAGRPVPLEPRAFQVLCALIDRAGELVEHNALIDLVWGGVFVTPHSLTEAISQIRRALDDDPRQPRIIETAHRRGYRFIAPFDQFAHGLSPRWRLPARLFELIGRDVEVIDIVSRLGTARFVTLVGPGGVGKTQLALEAARRLETTFADGARWIDLSSAGTSADVQRLVANAVGAPEQRGASFGASIGPMLRDAHVLLIFDNCERVAARAGQLAESVLGVARDVRVLATSQRSLAAAGEVLLRVAPLPCADAAHDGAPCAAVRLFEERAAAVQPGFCATGPHAHAVLQICRRLDGLPLAIDLAAAQVRVLSPAQILERLDARLAWPARRAEQLRHRTLGAMLEWSASLLDPGEEQLLEHVSVFPGSWDLEAAAVVTGQPTESSVVFAQLTGLVDKSLVRADTSGESARYRLLDSVRLFALERLGRSERVAVARDRTLAYCADLAARADRDWYTTGAHHWIERLREDRPNLRAAFEWAVRTPDRAELGLHLAADLRWFWRAVGDFVEVRSWLERALATAPRDLTLVRARATIALAQVAHFMNDFELARDLLRPILSRPTEGAAQDTAWAWSVQALNSAVSGDEVDCQEASAAALKLVEGTQNRWMAASTGLARGLCHAMRDEHGAAVELMTSAYEWSLSAGEEFLESYVATNLALQRLLAGDAAGSRALFLSALRLSRRLGNLRATAGCFEGFAYLATDEGHLQVAARLIGAAARIREITGGPLFPQWRRAHDARCHLIDTSLGPDLGARERAAGAATPVDELATMLLA